MAAKLASAKETIARLMRGIVRAPAAVSYRFVEPESERQFTKGMLLTNVQYGGRKDFIGLQLTTVVALGSVTRRVIVDTYDDDHKAVVFITDFKHNGRTWRVLKIKNDESICALSSTIHHFLLEGAICARLRKLRVGSSRHSSRPVGAGQSVPRTPTKYWSPSSSTSLSTSQQKKRPIAGKVATPPIVWTKKATSSSAAGRSLPSELPSRSRSTGTLHLPSATNSL